MKQVSNLMSNSQRIALVLPDHTEHVRCILKGVQTFAVANRSTARDWHFRFFSPKHVIQASILAWEPHGILAHTHQNELCEMLDGLGLPLVNTSSSLVHQSGHSVSIDDRRVGEIAAEHLLNLNLKCYAFYGYSEGRFSKDREAGFIERLKAETEEMGKRATQIPQQFQRRISDAKAQVR